MEIKRLSLTELDSIHALEQESYPADEAASYESLKYRLEYAPEYFLGGFNADQELVGFVCGTCTDQNELSHDTMSTHVQGGRYLCIHSVVIAPTQRRRKLATVLLRHYIKETLPHVDKLFLISKAHLISLYESVGFRVVRKSPVVHGVDDWFEMEYDCLAERE